MTQSDSPLSPSTSTRRGARLGASPFGPNIPSILIALAYLLAVFVWLIAGELLPGGRWFAVHLFTLGFLTNLILTFSHHFALTVTRSNRSNSLWLPIVTNAGIVLVLYGLPHDRLILMVAGATIVTGAVFVAYLRLRNMRRQAVGARFSFVVRIYERAHGAFIHGAVLGALVGANIVSGTWWGSVRLAHLHANVLGWAGLTLIATLVFFGPTMAHTKIRFGADSDAVSVLKYGAHALTIALGFLILTGFGGPTGTLMRLAAALFLGIFAYAITRVCVPVCRAVYAARPSAQRPLVIALTVWFPVVVWADALVVATGQWRWLDAVGAAAFTGVLGQAILATLLYLAPLLRGRSANARELIRARLEVLARTRAATLSAGALCVSAGALRLDASSTFITVGFVLLGVVAAWAVIAVLRPANERSAT